ncbi:Nucleoporin GLE1 [Trichoplax sp. H2]|nr:Nucleoporin GLE1 [Trichoplax sp. H2]|eukprot:RDD47336.1 Nucleoporin GLE1 [Trichoplax sp. H2]
MKPKCDQNNSSIIENLQTSPKGQLVYDHDWHTNPQRMKDILTKASQVSDTFVHFKRCNQGLHSTNDINSHDMDIDKQNNIKSYNKSYGLLPEYLVSGEEDDDDDEGLSREENLIDAKLVREIHVDFEARLATISKEHRKRYDTINFDLNTTIHFKNKIEFATWMTKMKEMKQSLHERSKIAVELKRKDRLQREMLANNRAQQLEELRNQQIKSRQLQQSHQQEEHVKMLESVASKGLEFSEYIEKQKRKLLEHMRTTVYQIVQIEEKINQIFNTYEKSKILHHLPKSTEDITSILKNLHLAAEQALTQADSNSRSIDERSVATVQNCLSKAKVLQQLVEKASNIIESEIMQTKAKELEAEKILVAKQKEAAAADQTNEKLPKNLATGCNKLNDSMKKNEDGKNETTKAKTSSSGNIYVPKFISKNAWKEYIAIMQSHKEYEQTFSNLVNDSKAKKYRFDLLIAITTPINTIASQSAEHLLDKIRRLHNLLSGKQVTCKGKVVTSTAHPEGPLFCRDIMASKFIKQADQQISASHASAFPIALTALGVWCEYPEMGNLFLAHFYSLCPYTVPFNIPRLADQNDIEYFKKLGYHVKDGNIEDEDQYLKRMSGIIRLYAAIIQSTPPQGPTHAHPHGIEYGWRWLARIVNMPPVPNVTATLIFDFLQVAGNKLNLTYGKQFGKLITLICKEYYPKLEAVTPKSKRGPLSRLLLFLQDCLKNRHIPKAEGHIDKSFWK